MKYDPIKESIGRAVRHSVPLRKVFYRVLGVIFLREWYVKRELRRLFRSAHPPTTMFDAGSGFGQYSYYCATRFPWTEILAVDVKSEQIDDCREFFRKAGASNVRFAVEDLSKSVHENEFDVVLSVDVMEHIPDDVGVFRNLCRALKSHGVLLINTPSNLGGSDVDSSEDTSFVGEHARNGYGVDEIRSKLTSCGFSVERVRFSYGRFGTIAWRLGIKYPMLMLNASQLMFLFLPFYYVVTVPLILPLMYIDYRSENRTGTGLVVVARKA